MNHRIFALKSIILVVALGLGFQTSSRALDVKPLLPEQSTRKERPSHDKRRFIAPEGFEVEEVAGNDLVGSVVNMTFDYQGRPALSLEHNGIVLLTDSKKDGKYDGVKVFCSEIQTAHGMHFIGPGDLLVCSNGPKGAGLYRVTDTNGDDVADKVEFIAGSRIGGIGEHGPHAILTGYDGQIYVMYGNHSYPDVTPDPASPSRWLEEDQLLPRYVDPRGHATNIRAPGGVVMRLNLATKQWSQFCAGFRNAFDFAENDLGEIFTFDSDMEWDVGLPWYRPIRVVHCIPGGDYGWRTGSGVFPNYYFDMLPPMEDAGRGSPVGMAVYEHHVYPEKFYGALFLGDWSRGRILATFNQRHGATYEGKSVEFVLGEPLNVTDLEIGPDGLLYFATGGRSTTGGLFRVRYKGNNEFKPATAGLNAALDQPMHRSSWGEAAIEKVKKELGAPWESELRKTIQDTRASSSHRVRALELLQTHGPKPDLKFLEKLARDRDAEVRASAVLLLGTFRLDETRDALVNALGDDDGLVARRACESLVRAGLNSDTPVSAKDHLVKKLFALLDSEDSHLRWSAKLALMRVDRRAWIDAVADDSIESRPRGALEGLLAATLTQGLVRDADMVFDKLLQYSRAPMKDDTLCAYLRMLEVAFIRDLIPADPGRRGFMNEIGRRLLPLYPASDPRVHRELEILLGYMQTPGAIEPMLAQLDPKKAQEDQIHAVYALRVINKGWTQDQRKRLIEWFDRGREMGGAASMEGYINDLWESVLANLSQEEKRSAQERKEKQLAERAKRAETLRAEIEGDRPAKGQTDLAQMGYQELSEYLEFDPMTYEKANAERGKRVFQRAKCANCHVFGTEGKGGGPDLSNVVKRFRRREILESIMYPSKVISDQYTALNVELKNHDTVNGMLAGETDATLTLITATGDKTDVPKDQIVERRPSTVSIMPEGLLDTMSLQDLVDLFAFLEKGSGM